MNPIPKAARPIVAYIRKHVKRPKKLPEFYGCDELSWGTNKFLTCPMGLCADALEGAPTHRANFSKPPKGFTNIAIVSFGQWWDAVPESDALAACDAIWGMR